MTINRLTWIGLTRVAAIGALAVGSLASAGTALASSGGATVLDHQLSQHLAPGGQADFQFQYGGAGDLAELVVLPTSGGVSQLSLRVIGPDNQAVELYDGGSTAAAIKDDVVNGPAGTYTVEVTNQDGQAASDFAISEQEKTVAAGDSSSNPQADS